MMTDPNLIPNPNPYVSPNGGVSLSPGVPSDGQSMESTQSLESVAVFCGNCSCGCPELFVDHAADEERRVVIADDFGQRVQMSLVQLSALVADVKSGALDRLLA